VIARSQASPADIGGRVLTRRVRFAGFETMTMLAFALGLVASALGVQDRSGRGEIADVFAIYLVAEPVDGRITAYGKGDWSQLRLSASPLIAGDDIISYELSTHSMRLRRDALARIPRPPVRGTPFIVIAQGHRVYLGVFITIASSRSFAVPAIVVDRYMLEPTQARDTLVIERAYPSTSVGLGPDPRSDERIKTALTALHKSKRDRY
jgi:hypothetical protein